MPISAPAATSRENPLRLIALLTAGLIAAGVAGACDDHHGECTIEDWRWQEVAVMEAIMIDGVATRESGKLALRLYEGEVGNLSPQTRRTSASTSSRR